MEDPIIPVSFETQFKFSCSPKVPCFNECCRDLNQSLTPYDVLRLKNHLGLSSGEFLNRYATQHVGPETGLPVVALRQEAADDFKCPFVTDAGCSVYENRPSSCRTYPLARLASRSRETGKITEQYVLIKEEHCQGFNQEKLQNVQEWVKNQKIEIYNEMNDLLMEIIALKNQKHPKPLDIRERHMFHLACYDLDTFRKQVFDQNLLKNMALDKNMLAAAKTDDTILLKLGFEWIKHALFGGE